MVKMLLMLLLLGAADALQATKPLQLRRIVPASGRSQSIAMSDVKGPKDWKFVKGVDAAGVEKTYMYLGAKDGVVEEEVNPIAEFLGLQGTGAEFLVAPWFICLFTPFLFAMGSVALTVLKL